MADEKKKRPSAVCVACGKTWPSEAYAPFNQSHNCDGKPKSKGGRVGSIQSRLNPPEDWIECKGCTGYGVVDRKRCERCNGDGHIECRDKPWIRDQQ